MSTSQLSIVIVNYKVLHFVSQCLDAVLAASTCIDVKVWVVDNASNDGSVEFLKQHYPWCNIIENSENVGFSKANNQALRYTKSPYVLLLNPDTIIGESTLVSCLAFMQNEKKVGALGVRMTDAQGNFLKESKRGLVTPFVALCKILNLGKLFPKSKIFNQYYLGHLADNKICQSPILSGAFMFMRREALEQVGFLDQRYFMYGEDVDLSYSILQAGFLNYYLPLPILHYKGESESASNNQARYLDSFYGAMELFYKKHNPKKKFMFILLRLVIRIKKKFHRNSVKKNIKGELELKRLNPDHPNPTEGFVRGTNVFVDMSDFTYENLLEIISSTEGMGLNFYTYNPQTKVLLGSGGLVSNYKITS